MRAFAIVVLVAASLASCTAPNQYFRPAEKADAESRTGRPAAEYQVSVAGRQWGEVRVWSNDAAVVEGSDDDAVLHVGFEIENALDEELQLDLDATRVEAVDVGDRQIDTLARQEVTGPSKVGAGNIWQVDLLFDLPAGVRPRDVRAFRVHWKLLGPGGAAYEQFTGFLADDPRRRYAYYGPYYGSFGGGFFYGPPWHYGYRWRFGPYWCW